MFQGHERELVQRYGHQVMLSWCLVFKRLTSGVSCAASLSASCNGFFGVMDAFRVFTSLCIMHLSRQKA